MKFSLLNKKQILDPRNESYLRKKSIYKMTLRRLRESLTLTMMNSQFNRKMQRQKLKIGSLNLKAKNLKRDGEERTLASMNC